MPNKRGKKRVMLALWISEENMRMLNMMSKGLRVTRSECVRKILFREQ